MMTIEKLLDYVLAEPSVELLDAFEMICFNIAKEDEAKMEEIKSDLVHAFSDDQVSAF